MIKELASETTLTKFMSIVLMKKVETKELFKKLFPCEIGSWTKDMLMKEVG